MYHISVNFDQHKHPLRGKQITGRGLHGVLYHVLKHVDPDSATWLHTLDAPKPYTVAPYFNADNGTLAGIRLTALTPQVGDLFFQSWQQVAHEKMLLRLGKQSFYAGEVACTNSTTFHELATIAPHKTVQMSFVSPTAFRQKSGHLIVPLPHNVFMRPLHVWESYAPPELPVPSDWLEWCQSSVFITALKIETASIAIGSSQRPFTGFVGDVQFASQSDAVPYMRFWHILAHLATYSGVGHKTTMGAGAVEVSI